MKIIFISLLLAVSANVFAASNQSPLPTATNVDIARYIGKWYAVTSLPQFFTKTCVAQTAEYQILTESSVSVLNTCIKDNGKMTDIKGKAVVVDPKTNARLEVTFKNFFTALFRLKGDYVIIKLSEGYDTVLVGATDRKSLWMLSRTPGISPEVYSEYKSIAKNLGFPVEKLVDSRF